MRKTHYFIAVPLANDVKERLAKWQETVAPRFPFRSWVHKEDYHITLAFLGDASVEQLQSVCQAMEQITKHHSPFSLSLATIGTFGNLDAPRILWQGVEKEEKLTALQRDVYAACVDIGFSLDRRPFKPHITVARKWQGEDEFRLDELRKGKTSEGSFLVDRIVLYQTHLDRLPKYEAIASFPLSSEKGEGR
jgi:2'-5' RNA ligase